MLTGRNPSETFLELADYVSEICMRKAPHEKGNVRPAGESNFSYCFCVSYLIKWRGNIVYQTKPLKTNFKSEVHFYGKEPERRDGFRAGGDDCTLTLDDGSEVECVVLTIFEAGDRDYIALLPTEGAEADEGEVYLYRYEEDADGNPSLDNIEDDDEYEVVADAFDELLDDQEFDEIVGEDELD